MENIELINKLNYSGELDFEEFKHLLSTYDQKDFEYAKDLAAKITKKIFGN